MSNVALDRETGRKRGFAFVDLSEADEQSAIDDLQNVEWMGRAISVRKAEPAAELQNSFDSPHCPKPRSVGDGGVLPCVCWSVVVTSAPVRLAEPTVKPTRDDVNPNNIGI